MNRRNFLKSIPVAIASLKAFTLPSMAKAAPVLRQGVEQFKIVFPDQTAWLFSGYVSGKSDDSLSITSTGAHMWTHDEYDDEDVSTEALSASGTTISYDNKMIGDIIDIVPPSGLRVESATHHHDADDYVVGLIRREPFNFQISFAPGADVSHLPVKRG